MLEPNKKQVFPDGHTKQTSARKSKVDMALNSNNVTKSRRTIIGMPESFTDDLTASQKQIEMDKIRERLATGKIHMSLFPSTKYEKIDKPWKKLNEQEKKQQI